MAVSAVEGAAAVEQKRSYNLPSGDAATTLNQFAGASGQQIVFMMEKVKGERTNAVAGDYAARDALDRMLAGTSLSATRDPATGAFVVSRKRTAESKPRTGEVGPVSDPLPKPPAKTMKSPRTLLTVLLGWITLTAPTDAQTSSSSGSGETATLSPFVVSTDKDNGFAAANAGTATRLALDMKDVPAAFSAMTSEFIEALAIVNIGEAASWMPNGSAESSRDDSQVPMQYNTRGVINNSGQQRNNYITYGLLDSYSIERYEFGRGPNAALFNIGAQSSLTGGLGAQTKKARYDRAFDTIAVSYGSWDYKRATVDVNRPLTNRLAVRGNAVWFDKGGWREGQWEKTKGGTAAVSYLLTPKTELRIEGAYDSLKRNNEPNWIYDFFSGWDGVTIYREPITNAILGSQTAAGAPNSFGQVLTFQGERQGVNRRTGEYYVWAPFSGQNAVMNYQNEATTRRADETANTPILANGVLYVRGTGLPFGNGSGSSFGYFPTANQNPAATAMLLYAPNLPADRFARAINGSAFRMPSKRYSAAAFESPIYTQDTKDVNLTLSHQIGDRWFFEIGGDINKVPTVTARTPANNVRQIRIDINQLLPNGMANPGYLQPYGDAQLAYHHRDFLNRSLRGNVGYRLNAGKLGDYVANLNLAASERVTENRYKIYSMALNDDPRMWQATTNAIYVRQYWNAPSRPFDPALIPGTVNRNVFASNNNSYTTATQTFKPRWVLNDWSDTDEKFNNAVLAVSAKYFGGKLVFLGASRYDRYSSKLRSRMEYGDLSVDWDGATLLYKPEAPADWAKLTYIPRNATTGVATATKAIPAVSRPRINPPGVVTNNGVQIYNPLFANDRFRNDYSPPVNKGDGLKGSYGVVYHARRNVSLVANYSTSYVPPPTNAFTLDNELALPLSGMGYDGGVRLNLFDGRLTVNTNYFFNREDHQRVGSPVTASVNSLLARNAANDPSLDGRNVQGIPDIFGTDYQSVKTSGVELEIVGNITRGWRMMCNVGTARVFTYNQYPLSKDFVSQNSAAYQQVLEDAGGRLDTTQHPNGAPGVARANPAVTAAIGSEQANSIIDYNNIWANYALVQKNALIRGQNRMTVNVFSDYTLQAGRFKGLRIGLGGQWAGRAFMGTHSADTIVDPNNPLAAIDDPTVDETTPINTRRPVIVTATLGYSLRLKGGKRWEGKELSFRLAVRNLLNNQMPIYDAQQAVIARPPNGDFSKPNRVGVPAYSANYTEPTSFIFTTTLKL